MSTTAMASNVFGDSGMMEYEDFNAEFQRHCAEEAAAAASQAQQQLASMPVQQQQIAGSVPVQEQYSQPTQAHQMAQDVMQISYHQQPLVMNQQAQHQMEVEQQNATPVYDQQFMIQQQPHASTLPNEGGMMNEYGGQLGMVQQQPQHQYQQLEYVPQQSVQQQHTYSQLEPQQDLQYHNAIYQDQQPTTSQFVTQQGRIAQPVYIQQNGHLTQTQRHVYVQHAPSVSGYPATQSVKPRVMLVQKMQRNADGTVQRVITQMPRIAAIQRPGAGQQVRVVRGYAQQQQQGQQVVRQQPVYQQVLPTGGLARMRVAVAPQVQQQQRPVTMVQQHLNAVQQQHPQQQQFQHGVALQLQQAPLQHMPQSVHQIQQVQAQVPQNQQHVPQQQQQPQYQQLFNAPDHADYAMPPMEDMPPLLHADMADSNVECEEVIEENLVDEDDQPLSMLQTRMMQQRTAPSQENIQQGMYEQTSQQPFAQTMVRTPPKQMIEKPKIIRRVVQQQPQISAPVPSAPTQPSTTIAGPPRIIGPPPPIPQKKVPARSAAVATTALPAPVGPLGEQAVTPIAEPPKPVFQTLKAPTMTIPKKKKPEPVAPVVATEVAQAAAVQRISTEEGWKQMNVWLKAADKDKKDSGRLKDLLKQCLQAKISVDMLQSNDTPKFVRRLTKQHDDAEVKSLANQLVLVWKNEVVNPDLAAKKEREKKKAAAAAAAASAAVPDENLEEEMSEDPSESNPVADSEQEKNENKQQSAEVKNAEKRRSTETDEASGTPEAKKERKAKARVYTAKSRLTGLEGEETEASDGGPEPKKKKAEEMTPEKDPKKVEKDKKEKKVASPKSPVVKKPPPTKKTIAVSSNNFMDALLAPPEAKKKPIPKKKVVEKAKEPTTSLLDGLFSDETKKNADRKSPTPSPPPTAAAPVKEEEEMLPPARRRIRFADEIGKPLELIKEFEIEEGERINVNRMSPEDMKHHEAMMEKKFRRQQSQDLEDEDMDTSLTEAPSSSRRAQTTAKWRLLELSDAIQLADPGCHSVAKFEEMERQKHALRVFFDPSRPSEITGEPDDYDPIAARQHVPMDIPTLSEEDRSMLEEQSASAAPAATSSTATPAPSSASAAAPKPATSSGLPNNLQTLLDGLKKQGIVGGGTPAPAAPAAPSAAASALAAILPGLNGLTPAAIPQISQIGAMPPGARNVYGQLPTPAAATYQQLPPNLALPTTSALHNAASSSGIHVVSGIDVHAPTMPVMGGGQPVQHPPQRPFYPRRGGYGGGQGYSSAPVCLQYQRLGYCKFGESCKFLHVDGQAAPPSNPRPPPFRGGFRGGPFRGGFRGNDRDFRDRPQSYARGLDHDRYRSDERDYRRDRRDRHDEDYRSPREDYHPSPHDESAQSPREPPAFSNQATSTPPSIPTDKEEA